PGASPAQTLIPVTVNVTSANPPKIATDQSQLVFSTQAGSGRTFRVLSVANSGSGTLNLTATASASSGNWLSVSPGSGSAVPGTPLSLVVSVDPTGLAAGTYAGKVVIASDREQVTIPVSLSISTPQPTVLLSQ